MNLYDLLEIKKDATEAEIKKAFKRMAMRHHSDRGGDAEMFNKITKARDILLDPERRARYDETGDCSVPVDLQTIAQQRLVGIFTDVLDSGFLEVSDIEQAAKAALNTIEIKINAKITDAENILSKMTRALGKIEFVGDGFNFYENLVNTNIKRSEEALNFARRELEVVEIVREMLKDYKSTVAPYEVRSPTGYYITSNTTT